MSLNDENEYNNIFTIVDWIVVCKILNDNNIGYRQKIVSFEKGNYGIGCKSHPIIPP